MLRIAPSQPPGSALRRVRLVALLVAIAAVLLGCSAPPEQLRPASGCRTTDGSCVVYRQSFDTSDGSPLPRATIAMAFTGPVRVPNVTDGAAAVTDAINLETGTPESNRVPVRDIHPDPQNPRQVLIAVDGLLADGATVELPDGTIQDQRGKSIGAVTATVRTGMTPFDVALAGVVWEPTDPTLFGESGVIKPRATRGEAQVRQELGARLRLRPGVTDDEIQRVLAQYDSRTAKQKVPDPRVRAGLLLLTGTTAEYAIQFLLADTNRRGVPFAPVEVRPITEAHAFAFVYHDPSTRTLHMVVDTDTAAESLENIALVLAHETLHSSLGGDSATQETLAMAMNTRVYEEFLLWDPSLAQAPTALTRQQNQLTLALRNSGRFAYPKAGILARPRVENALRGVAATPLRSFKDLLFHPDVYGELRATGDVGSEVLEAYFVRLSGDNGNRGRMNFDAATLKAFDEVMDRGFSNEQILSIANALKLRPVALDQTGP